MKTVTVRSAIPEQYRDEAIKFSAMCPFCVPLRMCRCTMSGNRFLDQDLCGHARVSRVESQIEFRFERH